MATVESRITNWALEEVRWASQINMDVLVSWYKKWLQIFQKTMLEYVSGMQNTSHVFQDIAKDTDEYELPLWQTGIPDFYSIIQLRIAYHYGKDGLPLYRICKPINFSDYNLRPMLNQYDGDWNLKEQWGNQVWWPYVWWAVSELFPRYVFIDKDHIKIFPTPVEDITNWLTLAYNYIDSIETIDKDTDESELNLPWYFFDAIEDYMTFRLYQAENPEMAQWYYQQFENTLHDNIYGLNKDKRPVEEWLANTTYFSHN